MKGRLTTLRRSAVAVGLSLSMVVAAGASAKAAPTTELQQYTASATSNSLHISLKFNDTLNQALQTVGGTLNSVLASIPGNPLQNVGDLLGNLDENISFSSATGVFNRADHKISGEAVGQTFNGTLDHLIASLLQVPATSLAKLQAVATTANTTVPTKTVTIKSIAIPSAAMPVINIGVGKQVAGTATQVTSAVSNGAADLASIDVSLAPLASALDSAGLPVSQTLSQLTQTVNGLIGQVNQAIAPVLQSAGLSNLLGQLQIPGLPDITKVSILHVGVMDGVASTSVQPVARLENGATEFRKAHSVNELAGVDVLGGLVHLDVLKTTADAALDNLAAHPSANADVQIVGLKIGNLPISVNLDHLQIGSQTISLPASLTQTLSSLVNVAGIEISGPSKQVSAVPGSGLASAKASSLHIGVAPSLGGEPLFALSLDGPASTAMVGLGTTQVEGKTIFAKTGLNDTMYLLYGVIFLAAAVLVRRFALSK